MTPLHEIVSSLNTPRYAVLDAARSDQVLVELARSQLDHRSLYEGSAHQQFRTVAPYLVALEPDHPGVDKLLHRGQGNAWGIVLGTKASFDDTRRHLRKLLKVELEGRAKAVYFRFYDPRVLREFLPTCDASQLERFFGPISFLLCESEQPGETICFMLDRGALVETRMDSKGSPPLPAQS